MANIEIGGRLHSTATGNVVTGANEVLDDTKNKKQSVINAEVDETIGDDNTAGTIKGRIKTAEGKLDTLNGDSSTSGSVDQRIAAAKSEVIGDAASDYNTLGKLEDKIQAEAQARQDAITAEANRATTRENQIYDLVHTPEQHYVTVATYADLANIASPSDDTVYRVSSYNGKTSQVDNTVYSEYGYDGTNFVFLCVKSQIDEVYDISAHHSNNTYVDLAAALDGGNNIPQSLQKGGMSVKFVQSSDNKYVQARCMAQNFTTDVTQWQGVDNEPTVESENIANSGGTYNSIAKLKANNIQRNDVDINFTNHDDSIDVIGNINEPDNRSYRQTIFRFVNYSNVTVSRIRIVCTVIPYTKNINVLRFFDFRQTTFPDILPSGNYKDVAIDGITEIDEELNVSGIPDTGVSIIMSVGNTNNTAYNTDWKYEIKGLKIFINDEQVSSNDLLFINSTAGISFVQKDVAEMVTLPVNVEQLESVTEKDYTQKYVFNNNEPDYVPFLQNAFILKTNDEAKDIQSIRLKCKFKPVTSNINVFRFYHTAQMNTTAPGASTGRYLPTGEYGEVIFNNMEEKQIDITIYPNLTNKSTEVFFAVGSINQTGYNIDWKWEMNDFCLYINGELIPYQKLIFHGVIGFSGLEPNNIIQEREVILTNKNYLQNTLLSQFKTISPNVLPIGNNFSQGQIAVPKGSTQGSFDEGYCESPVVFWDENRLKYGIVYTGYGYDSVQETFTFGQVGLAWSEDLITWTKDENAPILSPSHVAGDPDRGSITGPVMFMENGVYYLYYIGCSEEGYEEGVKSLCLAMGTDIYNLQKYQANPIISPNSGDDSYKYNVYHANIVKRNKDYFMFINCAGVRPSDSVDSENIVLFKSKDLIHWDFDGVALEGGHEVTDPDSAICGDPCIFDIGDGNLYMTTFRVSKQHGGIGTGTGLAVTPKYKFPYGWRKYNLTFGSGIKAFIAFRASKMYHFYNGEGNNIYVQISE